MRHKVSVRAELRNASQVFAVLAHPRYCSGVVFSSTGVPHFRMISTTRWGYGCWGRRPFVPLSLSLSLSLSFSLSLSLSHLFAAHILPFSPTSEESRRRGRRWSRRRRRRRRSELVESVKSMRRRHEENKQVVEVRRSIVAVTSVMTLLEVLTSIDRI